MRRPRLSSSSSSEDEDATSSDQYPLFTCIVDHFAWICCSTPGDLNEAPATAAAVLCSFALFLAMCFFLVSLAAASDHKNLIIRQEAKELGPPRHAFTHPPQFVDVVYTWVNGSHPEVEKTLVAAMASKTLPYRPHASRFRDDGLFQYAIRSLLAADGLTASVRHIYVVTSGEIPTWLLPFGELRPIGPDGTIADDTCHTNNGFTTTALSMPLETLLPPTAFAPTFALPAGGRRLFIVPHRILFPSAETELPTFNSNAILCVLHRLPQLGPWFLYADDDTIIVNRNLTLGSAWWDVRSRGQKLYFSTGHGIHRKRPKLSNNWEEAMSFMASLLDAIGGPSPPPPPSKSMLSAPMLPTHRPAAPPPPWPAIAPCGGPAPRVHAAATAVNNASSSSKRRSRSGAATAVAALYDRRTARGLLRYYARPQHMPVLFSRALVYELEERWADAFQRTRANKVRRGEEIELNFFYHHFLRVMRYPVVPMPSRRIEFLYAQRCRDDGAKGFMDCARLLRSRHVDFATFNDDATSRRNLDVGLTVLHKHLRAKFGVFGGQGG